MLAIVPVRALDGAKSRLSPVLGPADRRELVRSMLAVVLAACRGAEAVESILVVTPDPTEMPRGLDVLVDAGDGHADAVRLALANPRARAGVIVIMADCPLVNARSLDELAACARPVALAPSRDGGTNALAARAPLTFEPAFGVENGAAVMVERARAAGIEPAVVDDPLLALDVDTPEDMETLILSCP